MPCRDTYKRGKKLVMVRSRLDDLSAESQQGHANKAGLGMSAMPAPASPVCAGSLHSPTRHTNRTIHTQHALSTHTRTHPHPPTHTPSQHILHQLLQACKPHHATHWAGQHNVSRLLQQPPDPQLADCLCRQQRQQRLGRCQACCFRQARQAHVLLQGGHKALVLRWRHNVPQLQSQTVQHMWHAREARSCWCSTP